MQAVVKQISPLPRVFICHLIAFRPQGASPGTERHSKCPAINRVMVGPEGRDGGTVTHIMGKK